MSASKDKFDTILSDFKTYMRLERNMSPNSIAGYLSDCGKLFTFAREKSLDNPEDITEDIIEECLSTEQRQGLSKRSQARMVSAFKSLLNFMENEGIISTHPQDRIEPPKISRYLPSVLSVEEITAIIESVDLSKPEGHRNRAILETLYSCGLRVSEAVSLRVSDLFLQEQFIRVIGKGNKQRIIPIGEPAMRQILFYLEDRKHIIPQKGAEDILFLNRRGGKLSRVMVFNIVKSQAAAAGITKEISPHTFRHSFATHLIENGADIRIVQEMLGHESVLTTEIYTHIDSRKWQESILDHHPIQKRS